MADDDSPLLTPEEAGPGPRGRAAGCGTLGRRHGVPVREDSPLLTPTDGPGVPASSSVAGRRRARGDEVLPQSGERFLERSETADSVSRLHSSLSFGSSFGTAPSAEKYRRIEKVGVGAYGNVFKAENMETKEIVAIKAALRKEDPIFGGFPLSLLREVCILRRVRHENIVQIHEVAQTAKGDPLIVMEFCQASLLELISSQTHDLSFSEIKYITRQLLDATNHLHKHGILHRDLATKNVLFNSSGEIKVCDFGISRMAFGQDEEFGFVAAKDLEDPNMIVSLPYRAIELLLGDRRYGPALDVWSVGCIFAEVLLYRSGRRLPLFSGSLERPNRTPEAFVEEIFTILGKPHDETWPGVGKLPLFRSFSSSRIAAARQQTEPGEEKHFIKHWFLKGDGRRANQKYCLTESCFDLLAGLLTLCPARRTTPEEALGHVFFTTEKPMPEWHAWHWNMEKGDNIARGDKCRRGDDAERLLRQLSKEEPGLDDGLGDAPAGGGEARTGNRVLDRLRGQAEQRRKAEERKAEERKAADRRAAAAAAKPRQNAAGARGGGAGPAAPAGGGSENLPAGWTKHWSSSKQRFYYHNIKSGANTWEAPAR